MMQKDIFRNDGHVDGIGDGEWFYIHRVVCLVQYLLYIYLGELCI